MLDSSQFLNEINHFKVRLDTLEKERFELEDKVRRLQVNVFCQGEVNAREQRTSFSASGRKRGLQIPARSWQRRLDRISVDVSIERTCNAIVNDG